MALSLDLDRLPRTVSLSRAQRSDAGATAFRLDLLDQSVLPYEESYLHLADWREVVDAVKTLKVRGAPAIGVAGAAAVALAAAEVEGDSPDADEAFMDDLAERAQLIAQARPTAVNLAWAVEGAMAEARRAMAEGGHGCVTEALYAFVKRLEREDEAANRAIGAAGAALLKPGSRVLTHCNAGSLATAFYGTALGVVYAAVEQGKIARVYADETRPVGQGARLTVWELSRAGVPCTLLCDNMAASVMAAGLVDAVVVGADRIAANGDTANKIGTYGVAVLAHHHGIPFYVAAPSSTIDPSCSSGADIPIEQRAAEEVLAVAIEGVDVMNPAFDVTPASLISGIVTERGVFPPDEMERVFERR